MLYWTCNVVEEQSSIDVAAAVVVAVVFARE